MRLVGIIEDPMDSVVTGIEMFRRMLDEGQAGDNAGILLRGVDKEDLQRGMVLCAPGSITPHKKFECEVYVLSKDEGTHALFRRLSPPVLLPNYGRNGEL